MNLLDRITDKILPGSVIPKPEGKADFRVKGLGKRRNERALIYTIPNHNTVDKPYEKGISASEWEAAYGQLNSAGELSRKWFNENLSACAQEGGCNFTTIGGIFELLGIARYDSRGLYRLVAAQ